MWCSSKMWNVWFETGELRARFSTTATTLYDKQTCKHGDYTETYITCKYTHKHDSSSRLLRFAWIVKLTLMQWEVASKSVFGLLAEWWLSFKGHWFNGWAPDGCTPVGLKEQPARRNLQGFSDVFQISPFCVEHIENALFSPHRTAKFWD